MVSENSQNVDTSSLSAIVSLTDNGHACVREGYPILLLRKSAVNKVWSSPYSQLFSFFDSSQYSLDDREPQEPLQDHNEVLRVLREGYVYVLAGTDNKKDYIRYYEVLEGGILREKAPEDLEIDNKDPFPTRCLADNHYVTASFISVDISNDDLSDKPFLWIAYSRYPWNKQTLDYYKNSQDLARFTKIDLTSFIQAPNNHPRGIDLANQSIFSKILEFTPHMTDKLSYLPNYQDKSKQSAPFINFINARKSKYKKPVGAVILEDPLGMVEDLNFQRLAEVNYTGDAKLHNKIDNKSDIPYEYHELHTPEGQYKKLNYDLIEQYKIAMRKYFDENSTAGTVFVSNLDNIFSSGKWPYGGSLEIDEETANLRHNLSQAEKAHYDFDQYWAKLNNQLKLEEYNRFADKVKQYEKIKKNNGRDYTLYCRWLFCDKLSASDFFSGRKHQFENKEEITFPEQKISSFNTVKFWEQEFNYDNQDIHNDILNDSIQIFRSHGNSYYDMGLWDELLSSDETYFHKVIAGKNPSFWKEGDIKSLADKGNELNNFLIEHCLINPIMALAQSQAIQPESSGKQLEKITNAQGVQKALSEEGHTGAKSRTITFNINTGKISALESNKNVSITSQTTIDGTKKTTITLTVFCDDNGFKNIEDYVKRTNRGNRAANDVNNLARVIDENVVINNTDSKTVNSNLKTEDFYLTLPEERFNQLDAQLKTKHGSNFSGFEIIDIDSKNGLITATFKGRGTQENINELNTYLQRYASNTTKNRFATVKTLINKITNNHIDISIDANTLTECAQEMGNVIKESVPSITANEPSPHLSNTPVNHPSNPKLRVAYAASSTSILFEFLLLAWQVKLYRDNIEDLQKTNLTQEQRSEAMAGLIFASVSISINTITFITNSVDKLAKMAGNFKSKIMISVTNKAVALSEKTVMKVLINHVEKLANTARVLGVFEGVKEMWFGYNKTQAGFYSSGGWQMASGVLLGASMFSFFSGLPGLVLSVVCIALSIFCAFMSEWNTLTLMERWFDRCYFGLNQLTNNLYPYPLTEDGVKKLIHGFYGASRGYNVSLSKKSKQSFIFDYGDNYDIYLNLTLPDYKPGNVKYSGYLIVEKKDSSQHELIEHILTGMTFESTTSEKIQLKTCEFDKDDSLVIIPPVYVADKKIDKKITVYGFFEEQNGSGTPFTIELEDYIDI